MCSMHNIIKKKKKTETYYAEKRHLLEETFSRTFYVL